MKNMVIIAIIMASVNSFAQVSGKNFIDQNYIEVTGKAEMEIVPDEIYLKIFVNEKDYKGKHTLEEIEGKMQAKLSALGINVEQDLAVRDMTSNFSSYWQKTKSIHTIREYQLLVHSAKSAGQVFQQLESLGISNISIDRTDHSEMDDFKMQVKLKAIAAAQQKATSLTETIGQNCGRAIYIREVENRVFKAAHELPGAASNILVKGYANAVHAASDLEIEFEKIRIDYSIQVRFELN